MIIDSKHITLFLVEFLEIYDLVTRMMTQGYDKDACLSKVESCVSHLNSLRGRIPADQFAAVEDALRWIRITTATPTPSIRHNRGS